MDDKDRLILRYLRDPDVKGDIHMSRKAALLFMKGMGPVDRQHWLSLASAYYGKPVKVKAPSRAVDSLLASDSKVREVVEPPPAAAAPSPVVSVAPAALKPSRGVGRPALPDRQRKKLVSVYLDPVQIEGLNKLTRSSGSTTAYHIREAIGFYLAKHLPQSAQDGLGASCEHDKDLTDK